MATETEAIHRQGLLTSLTNRNFERRMPASVRRCKNPFMVRLGSPRTGDKLLNSRTYPLAWLSRRVPKSFHTIWRA